MYTISDQAEGLDCFHVAPMKLRASIPKSFRVEVCL